MLLDRKQLKCDLGKDGESKVDGQVSKCESSGFCE